MSHPVPLISVIVPCFNGADWVVTAVRSVLDQDMADIELILADDCSNDRSLDVAREAAAGDRRLVVLASTRNRGMTANWNLALSHARGRYVCKLDCDDAWSPGTLAALLSAHRSNPDLLAAFCRTVQCDSNLDPISAYLGDGAFVRRGVDPAADAIRPAEHWYEWCFDDIQLWHSNAFMLRREFLLERLGGWDERFACASDTDLILRVLEHGGDVAHLSHVGVRYRSTPGSVSDAGRREGWVAVEGMLAAALSLQRTAARRRLSRHLATQRQRYRSALRTLVDGGYRAPARVAAGHAGLLADLHPQPLVERLAWRARCAVSDAFHRYAAPDRY